MNIDLAQIAQNDISAIHATPQLTTKEYNQLQRQRLKKVRDEVKWLVGERLGYDPDTTDEGRREVEVYFAGVIVSGVGIWSSKLAIEELTKKVESTKIAIIVSVQNDRN